MEEKTQLTAATQKRLNTEKIYTSRKNHHVLDKKNLMQNLSFP